jgi:hypothetical protein
MTRVKVEKEMCSSGSIEEDTSSENLNSGETSSESYPPQVSHYPKMTRAKADPTRHSF